MKIWKPIVAIIVFLVMQTIGGIVLLFCNEEMQQSLAQDLNTRFETSVNAGATESIEAISNAEATKNIETISNAGATENIETIGNAGATESIEAISNAGAIDIESISAVQFNAEGIALATIISGIISVMIIWLALKMIDMRNTLTPRGAKVGKNWLIGFVSIIGAIIGIFGTNLLSEQMSLTDIVQDEFIAMSDSIIGIISIGIAAPMIEELVFREGICGYLLRHDIKPSIAIGVSAFLFGAVHLNPAQIPFAFIIGIVLGIMYWKTKNIWLCSLVHIANNMTSVMIMHNMGEQAKDITYSELLGSQALVWSAILASALVSGALMWIFSKKYVTRN